MERAEDLARRCQGRACPWCGLLDELAEADMVVSTTGATQPIVTLQAFLRIEPRRGGRPLFILDLAVPRDFEPSIGERAGVYLYSIDDLQAECERNRRLRERELPGALRIVEKEADRFMADLHFRLTGPVIRQLKEMGDRTREAELQRLLNKLPDLEARGRRDSLFFRPAHQQTAASTAGVAPRRIPQRHAGRLIRRRNAIVSDQAVRGDPRTLSHEHIGLSFSEVALDDRAGSGCTGCQRCAGDGD